MSRYTTGELAKLCGVTVRTVQYYDTRGLLIPSGLSEGGRRLYSEDDARKLTIICFLRELGLPLDAIRRIFSEEKTNEVIQDLLAEQGKLLQAELRERQEKLRLVEQLQAELKKHSGYTADSIGDIAYIMKNRKKLRHVHMVMLAVGFVMDAIEVATLMLWILKGIWLPFVLGMLVVVLLGVLISVYYWKNTSYLCPQCHIVFRPRFQEALWAKHTPRTRRLHCCACGYHGYCAETYADGAEGGVGNAED